MRASQPRLCCGMRDDATRLIASIVRNEVGTAIVFGETNSLRNVLISSVFAPMSIAVTTYCQLVVLSFCRAMCLIDDLLKRGRRFVFTLPANVDSAVGEMLVHSYRAVVAFIGGSDVASAVIVQQATISGLRQGLRMPKPAIRCRLPGCVQSVVLQGT